MSITLPLIFDNQVNEENTELENSNIKNKQVDIKTDTTDYKFRLSYDEWMEVKRKQYEERGENKDIMEKYKVEEKLKDLYKEIQKDKDALETELKAQGKKDNVYDLDQKKKICQLLKEKIGILEKKF